jgi:chloride channel protein, CIC family
LRRAVSTEAASVNALSSFELWSLLGMASMMGGTMRSLLTGIIFAVELTDKVELLVPLLVATGCAYAVTVLLLKRSILTEKIARRGQHITREYSVDPFELLRVSEVMVASPQTLPSTMSIDAAISLFKSNQSPHKSYPLVDQNQGLVGMVARADILRWSTEGNHSDETLFERVSDNAVLFGYPDEVVARLADRVVVNDAGRVPIIDRQTRRVIGLVARKDLLKTRLGSQSAEKDRTAYFRKDKTKKVKALGTDALERNRRKPVS